MPPLDEVPTLKGLLGRTAEHLTSGAISKDCLPLQATNAAREVLDGLDLDPSACMVLVAQLRPYYFGRSNGDQQLVKLTKQMLVEFLAGEIPILMGSSYQDLIAERFGNDSD